jgi:hypothetical protein
MGNYHHLRHAIPLPVMLRFARFLGFYETKKPAPPTVMLRFA